jgi:type 1 glutamine amidotransferase
MHQVPLTKIERDGLIAHGFKEAIGKPNQAADIFRHGIAWALRTEEERAVAVAESEALWEMINEPSPKS